MQAYRRSRIPGKIDPGVLASVPEAIEITSTGTGYHAGGYTMGWSATVGSAPNRLLVVVIGSNYAITEVKWGLDDLTLFDTQIGDLARCSIWYLVNPETATKTIGVVSSDVDYMEGGSISLSNVDQATPLSGFDGSHGSTGDASVTIAGAVGDLALGWIKCWDDAGSPMPDGGMTELFNPTSDGSWQTEAASKPGDTSVELGWTVSTAFDAVWAAVMVNKA